MKHLKKIAWAAAILLIAAACHKLALPEAGRYYRVQADGEEYFVWIDGYDEETANGHYYPFPADGDTVAVKHDFTSRFSRRGVKVTSDGETRRFKNNDISYSAYEEPPFETGDLRIYREKHCKVGVTTDMTYGNVQGYWASLPGVEQEVIKAFTQGYLKSFKKRDLNLSLDLYKPEGIEGKRPLILFIHGGAFYIGNKEEPAYIDFCEHFASMGYICASINYRLGFHLGKNEIERAGYMALQDAHAAIRYLVANSDETGVDPDLIYVAGSSAGSITALNLAFMKDDQRPGSTLGKKAFLTNRKDLGGIETSGNDLKADFNIVAIANMWGAVCDPGILENGRTSIVSFHGEEDRMVPYDEGYPLASAGEGIAKLLSEKMYGSASIDRKAEETGIRHHFYSFPGEGHALNTNGKDKQPNANHGFIKDRMAEFFFEEMAPVKAVILPDGKGGYSIAGKGIEDVQWKADGGFIIPASDSGIRVIWCADKPHKLTAAGTYGRGIGWTADL